LAFILLFPFFVVVVGGCFGLL